MFTIEIRWIKQGNLTDWEVKRKVVLSNINVEAPCSNPIINELRVHHNFLHMYPILVNKYTGDTLELSVLGNLKILHIDFIGVTQKRQGRGTKLMGILTSLSDKYNYTLQLEVYPKFGVSKKTLLRFYKSFGFVHCKGSKDKYERIPNKVDKYGFLMKNY